MVLKGLIGYLFKTIYIYVNKSLYIHQLDPFALFMNSTTISPPSPLGTCTTSSPATCPVFLTVTATQAAASHSACVCCASENLVMIVVRLDWALGAKGVP